MFRRIFLKRISHPPLPEASTRLPGFCGKTADPAQRTSKKIGDLPQISGWILIPEREQPPSENSVGASGGKANRTENRHRTVQGAEQTTGSAPGQEIGVIGSQPEEIRSFTKVFSGKSADQARRPRGNRTWSSRIDTAFAALHIVRTRTPRILGASKYCHFA